MYLNFFRYGGEGCAELRLESLQSGSCDGGFRSSRESIADVFKRSSRFRELLRLPKRLREQQREARTLLDLRLSRQYLDGALGPAGLKEGLSQQRERVIPQRTLWIARGEAL